MERRRFVALCSAAGTAALSGCLGLGRDWEAPATRGSPIEDGGAVGLELVAEGFRQPIAMEPIPGTERWLVADKLGPIYLRRDGAVREEPFLDLTGQLAELTSIEQGVLGLALHPEFDRNRTFYVRYSAPPREGTPEGFSHTFVLSEFRATADRERARPGSERPLLELPQPRHKHQAGAIEFGPDGYLYVATGDGGREGSPSPRGIGQAKDWYLLNRGGNGQDVAENLLGSILRIDVDGREDGKPYAIPDDNPLVGEDGLDEHWAWGLRNPYRMSFHDGDLLVGDVGAGTYEEVDVVRRGGNYGWNVREGPICFDNVVTGSVLDDPLQLFSPTYVLNTLNSISGEFLGKQYCPRTTPGGDPLVDPVVAYPHTRDGDLFGSAVVGGYVYGNDAVPAIEGKYVFGDFLAGRSGRLFAARPRPADDGLWPVEALRVVAPGGTPFDEAILSFGRDTAGELYVLTARLSEEAGHVYRLTAP